MFEEACDSYNSRGRCYKSTFPRGVQAKVRTCPSLAQPISGPPCVLALLSVLVSRAAWASVGGRDSRARALQNKSGAPQAKRVVILILAPHPTAHQRLGKICVSHRSPIAQGKVVDTRGTNLYCVCRNRCFAVQFIFKCCLHDATAAAKLRGTKHA